MSKYRRFAAIVIASIFGLLGLNFLFFGLCFICLAIADHDFELMRVLNMALFLLFGALPVWIGYQVVFKPTDKAIKHLCGFIGITTYMLAQSALDPITDKMIRNKELNPHTFVLMFIPFVLGIIVYKCTMRLFRAGRE